MGLISMDAPQTGEFAHIGKSVVIKGEIIGLRRLCMSMATSKAKSSLRSHSVTVGPNGKVKADVNAKSIVVQGKVDGSLTAPIAGSAKSAVVTGDVTTQRIAIEEGAFLKGKVDIQKEAGKGTATS